MPSTKKRGCADNAMESRQIRRETDRLAEAVKQSRLNAACRGGPLEMAKKKRELEVAKARDSAANTARRYLERQREINLADKMRRNEIKRIRHIARTHAEKERDKHIEMQAMAEKKIQKQVRVRQQRQANDNIAIGEPLSHEVLNNVLNQRSDRRLEQDIRNIKEVNRRQEISNQRYRENLQQKIRKREEVNMQQELLNQQLERQRVSKQRELHKKKEKEEKEIRKIKSQINAVNRQIHDEKKQLAENIERKKRRNVQSTIVHRVVKNAINNAQKNNTYIVESQGSSSVKTRGSPSSASTIAPANSRGNKRVYNILHSAEQNAYHLGYFEK
jgi:hypothetical protein